MACQRMRSLGSDIGSAVRRSRLTSARSPSLNTIALGGRCGRNPQCRQASPAMRIEPHWLHSSSRDEYPDRRRAAWVGLYRSFVRIERPVAAVLDKAVAEHRAGVVEHCRVCLARRRPQHATDHLPV